MSIKNLKVGTKIIIKNEPYNIENIEFVNPGKGKSFIRIKLRNLLNKKIIKKNYKNYENLEIADILDIKCFFIYKDKNFYYFMNSINFEHIKVSKKIIKNKRFWIKLKTECNIIMWNNFPIDINIPNFINLLVTKTIKEKKKYSISNNTKYACLGNNLNIKVPLFIKKNDIIKIDTRSIKYIARVKK